MHSFSAIPHKKERSFGHSSRFILSQQLSKSSNNTQSTTKSMKFLATFSTILALLSLAPGSTGTAIGTDDEDTRSLLRARKLNTVSYSSEDSVVGRLLNPPGLDPPLPDRIIAAFQSCVDDWKNGDGSAVYCDIYFNPHTDYSYYRNPSAVGVLRGQLCYNGNSKGNTHYFSVPEATSEIMDDLMTGTGLQATGGAPPGCAGAQYTKLGPDVASAVAEVSWKKGKDEIVLLSSTIVLKNVQTKDIRCKYCDITNATTPDDGVALTCTEQNVFEGNSASYSNTNIIGSHLHLGGSTVDGPPPVFFCKNDANPLSPPDGAFLGNGGPDVCSNVY